ncbi:hypothetical protein SEA_EMOTION_27 [Arthrobacter phage Emotion]|uniref:Uncharacterized protein n=1 Tax=Arthrobacter phage Emotion TaxID=3038361 RepID=A0AA49ERP4_9CAUD|nr:hypothetical protein SEA_EMOTION_27 [Arthrobacter phage Emotion]
MATTLTRLADLQRTAVAALRRYLADARTEDLREVATCYVEARAHFYTKEGRPDWLGRTHAYRSWVRESTGMANVPPDDLATVQAAIRYHSGNVLRERLSEDEVEALGLKPESPRERSVVKREHQTAILSLFGTGGAEITDADEIVHMVEIIEATLQRISHESIAAMSSADRRRVRTAARALAKGAEEVMLAAGARRA